MKSIRVTLKEALKEKKMSSSLRREKREEEDALLRRAANAATDATNATNTNRFKSGNDYFEEEEEEMDVAAMMGFSGGFGSKKKKHNREQQREEQRGKGGEGRREEEMERKQQNDDEDDASVIGRRMQNSKKEDKEGALNTNEADEDDDLEEDQEYEKLPISDEIELGSAHKKTVTTIAVERTGSRFVTGARDGFVKLYDFNGMRKDLHPFREIEPNEGYPVHSLDWSPSGDAFVVATGSNKAKVFDRDGRELGEFESGDMYILDSKNTRGHTHNVTKACWNPIEKNLVITSADDGTVRIWNVDYLGDPRGSQRSVVKPQSVKPGRFRATTCAFNMDGSLIAMALTDGSIQLFPANSKRGNIMNSNGSSANRNGGGGGSNAYKSTSVGLVLPPSQQSHLDNNWTSINRPKQLFKKCHQPDEEISSLCFNEEDGRHQMLSRATDGTLKVWDLRNAQKPVKVFDDLPASYGETTVAYSPNGSKFFTGCDGEDVGKISSSTGSLHVFDSQTLERVAKISSSEQNVVCATWHQRLNQLFVGSGTNDRKLGSRGKVSLLYDTNLSAVDRGAMLAIGKNPRSKNADDFYRRVDVQNILHVPNALPLFQEPVDKSGRKRRLNKIERNDPNISKKPQTDGSGAGDRPAQRGSTLLTQHLLRNDGMLSDQDWRLGDARESILRHAKDAAEHNVHTNAEPNEIWYDSDQDKDDSEDEEKDDDGDEEADE